MDCSLPGRSVHGILQARILEWVIISFSRGSSPPRDGTCVSCIGRWIFSPLSHLGSLLPWLPTCSPGSAPTSTLLAILFLLYLMRSLVFLGPNDNRVRSTKLKVKVGGSFPKLSTSVTLTVPLSPSLWLTFLLFFQREYRARWLPYSSGHLELLTSALRAVNTRPSAAGPHTWPLPRSPGYRVSRGKMPEENLRVCLECLPTAPLTAQTLEETAPMCLCEQALELSHKTKQSQ